MRNIKEKRNRNGERENRYKSSADQVGYSAGSEDQAGHSAGSEDARSDAGTGIEGMDTSYIEGRNEVIEAFRSGKTIDKVFILDGSHDGKLDTIRREAKKAGVRIDFVEIGRAHV